MPVMWKQAELVENALKNAAMPMNVDEVMDWLNADSDQRKHLRPTINAVLSRLVQQKRITRLSRGVYITNAPTDDRIKMLAEEYKL